MIGSSSAESSMTPQTHQTIPITPTRTSNNFPTSSSRMGDPLSVAGLVLAIPPVVAGLISLTSDYKEAKNDIQTHIGALFTIKGILEYIHSVQMMASSTDVYSFETDEFVSLLRTTKSTIEKLQESLQPKKSAFGQSIQRATWHWKKKEILERLDGLERLKTSFLMTMLGDNM
jgi:hypothetical protein